MKIIIMILIGLLAGCEVLNREAINSLLGSEAPAIQTVTDNSLAYEEQVERLVDELSSLDKYEITAKNTIVSTFVWNKSFTAQSEYSALSSLGINLAEQTKHRLVQHDANIVEGYSTKSLSISDEGIYFLSRDLDELYTNLDVDYVITGVMSKQKTGIIVNAYVVDFSSKLIVGSAQQLFSYSIFSDENQATIKDGKIFVSREGY